MPTKALQAIDKVDNENVDHWLLYRKSHALLATNALPEALKTAATAFKLVQDDPWGKSRISIYHDLLSQCHDALKDNTKALLEAQLALEYSTNPKYQKALRERISKLTTS